MRIASSLVAASLVAAVLVAVGAHDLECYENAFHSLDRGTNTRYVTVLGQPVYTLSLGLGVRLPLHGNLGASPAALLAPRLPAPLTHWLLLTAALAAAIVVVQAALEPLGGPAVSWLAVLLLFCSAPMVAYTVYNDWPETAITYCALVGGVFAPLALLQAGRLDVARRRLAVSGLLAVIFGLFAASHPGYWPQLAGALGLSMAFLLLCPSYTRRERLLAIAGVGTAAALGVFIQVPDILREAALGAGLPRDTQGPTGDLLITHLFPLSQSGARVPFALLPVAVVSIILGLLAPRVWRPLVVAAGAASIAVALAASTLLPGSVAMAPSTTWTLRDAATVFAVLSAMLAASVLVGRRRRWGVAALLVVGAQGPLYAASLLWAAPSDGIRPWNHDWRTATMRLAERGMPVEDLPPGFRTALWPGGRTEMRLSGQPSTDWPDAGYPMVTAWTKNRTMAQLVRPNEILFDQTTDLDTRVLCDPAAAGFLRLRYLLLPPGQSCEEWTLQPNAVVDGRWAVATRARDDRVRTVRLPDVSPELRSRPALGDEPALVRALVPQPGTSIAISADHVSLTLANVPGDDIAVVLPVAYDPAWHASSGRVLSLGGLLAVSGADAAQLRVDFVPDARLRIRAIGMRMAQVLSLFGLVALGLAGRTGRFY